MLWWQRRYFVWPSWNINSFLTRIISITSKLNQNLSILGINYWDNRSRTAAALWRYPATISFKQHWGKRSFFLTLATHWWRPMEALIGYHQAAAQWNQRHDDKWGGRGRLVELRRDHSDCKYWELLWSQSWDIMGTSGKKLFVS